jgi:hypothetical protein
MMDSPKRATKRPSPQRPTIDAYQAVKMLDAIYPQTGTLYVVASMGDLLRVIAKLDDAGYCGSVSYWTIADRQRRGLPAVCGFVSLHPAGGKGGWEIRRQDEATAGRREVVRTRRAGCVQTGR